MLYFIIKFVKLFVTKPFKVLKHLSNLKFEWQVNRTGRRINELASTAPQYFETCFVQHQVSGWICDDNHCIEKQMGYITAHMDRAKYTIDLAVYVLSSLDIADALDRATKRGVRVRILYDTEHIRTKKTFGNRAEFRRAFRVVEPEAIMHHKICIIDGYGAQRLLKAKKGDALAVCMTGSMNLVYIARGCDDMCITSAPKIARRLEIEFERMWKKF